MTLPIAFYLVITDYGPGIGFGSPDATTDRDRAYDEYDEKVSNGQPTKVLSVNTACDLCLDVTEEFGAERRAIRKARRLEYDVAAE